MLRNLAHNLKQGTEFQLLSTRYLYFSATALADVPDVSSASQTSADAVETPRRLKALHWVGRTLEGHSDQDPHLRNALNRSQLCEKE